MAIQLVDVDEMRTGRGGGKGKEKGQKYAKYRLAIQKIVPFLKESIEAKGTIRAKIDDIKKEMGGDFVTKHSTSIYWGLKFAMFQEGIWVTTGKHKDGGDVLVLRSATPEDKLPDSLTKGGGGVKGEKEDDEHIPDVDTDKDEKDPIDEDEDEDEDK